jgi:hypothetical protein
MWVVGLSAVAGCGVRLDPSYNRYAPTDGDPTVLEHAQGAVDAAGNLLDKIDQRIENAVY